MRAFETLALGPRLGTGGEADVFQLVGESTLAVKLYRSERAGRAAKLRTMATSPAPTEESTGRLAWPRELVMAADGSVRGFVMERFDPSRFRPLHQVYNPSTRRSVAPGFDTRYLLRTARNLAATVAAVHAAGAVVGDLNESNVLVDASGNVALVDCDSFQVIDHQGVVHPCPVGKPEFTPPELHGIELAGGERHPSADVFALAVLVSLLLREGRHPYAGIWVGRGDPPDLASCARRRRLPHRNSQLKPAPMTVPWSALPRRIRALSHRSLTAARWRATMRPSADAWARALAGAENALRPCRRSEHHLSSRAKGRPCPWCSLVDAGVPDPFPGDDGGVEARATMRGEITRRMEPARRAASAVITHVGPALAPLAAHRNSLGWLARRELPVALAFGCAAAIAPLATLIALSLVALPLAALDWRAGLVRAVRRLPHTTRAAWRDSALAAGASLAATVAVVGLLWWSPTLDEPFARWSPSEAGARAARSAAVVTAVGVGLTTVRRVSLALS